MLRPEIDTPAPFGWCQTGHHDSCRYEIGGTNSILTCSCPCHQEKP